MRSGNIRWLRLVAEGIAIVVSILLAFAIDAWWDVRGEAAEEREILLGLQEEFSDLRDRLDLWAGRNRMGARLAERFLSDSVAAMTHAEADSVLLVATFVNVLDQGGPLDALLVSGRLELIRDRQIRARLAKWPDWLEDIHTNDLSSRDFAVRELIPYLARYGLPGRVCPEGRYVCSGSEPIPASYQALSRDSTFRAMLSFRRTWMWATAVDHENAREEADQLLAMIHDHLLR